MKKFLILFGIAIIIAGGVMFFLQQRTSASKQVAEEFKFEVLERGNLENIVSSTGTLSAVGTVEVGSQISGIVDKVNVDYNDQVKKGQILAVIDKTLLETAVRDAEASLAKAKAQLAQAETEYQRNQNLLEKGYISEMTVLNDKTTVEASKAAVISAEAAVKKARINLRYAEIRSPIDGTVIARSVEAGQTISASQSAPTLFTIAQNLNQMQIEASVDESDIGQIKEGMTARFTVQAYTDETFTGTVRQIRLEPKTVQSVVNYTVMVDAMNDKGLLLPGMTATVEFIIDERQDVLLIPNTALSFRPSEALMAQLQQQFQGTNGPRQRTNSTVEASTPNGQQPPAGQPGAGENAGQGANGQRRQGTQNQAGTGGNSMMPMMPPPGDGNGGPNVSAANMARVFYLDDQGNPRMARFVKGVTDGSKTEVVQSAQLMEGVRVITGANGTQKKSESQSGFGMPIPGLGGPGGPR